MSFRPASTARGASVAVVLALFAFPVAASTWQGDTVPKSSTAPSTATAVDSGQATDTGPAAVAGSPAAAPGYRADDVDDVDDMAPKVAWAALVLALASGALAGHAWRTTRHLAEKVRHTRPREPAGPPPMMPRALQNESPSPRTGGRENEELRGRVEDLETRVAQLREQVDRPATVVALSARAASTTSEVHAVHGAEPRGPTPKSDVQVLPGVLSADEQVRVSTSSRPMVQIHWSPAASTADVWVNPDYKFADLTADFLASAFEVESRGPGSYETIAPAVIAWSSGASAGRVQVRGRVRAIGA